MCILDTSLRLDSFFYSGKHNKTERKERKKEGRKKIIILKKLHARDEEMVLKLKAVTLAEDQASAPSTRMVANNCIYNSSSREPTASPDFPESSRLTVAQTHI